MAPLRVLFVCLGNICRSPLAEGIMKHKLNAMGLKDQILVDSCGTSNYHIGDKPDSRTRENAERNGVILNHRGRQITSDDLESFDFIVAMDLSNKKNVFTLASNAHRNKVKLMREFDHEPGDEVPDPYYGDEDDFQEVFDILNRSIDGFISHLQREGKL